MKEEKKEVWDKEVYPGGLETPSETTEEDFDMVTPEEYRKGVGDLFDVISDPQPVPEERIREPPREEPINEYLRPNHLQGLTEEAETEILRGVSSLMFDRMEKILEKEDKNEKSGPWDQIVG